MNCQVEKIQGAFLVLDELIIFFSEVTNTVYLTNK